MKLNLSYFLTNSMSKRNINFLIVSLQHFETEKSIWFNALKHAATPIRPSLLVKTTTNFKHLNFRQNEAERW